MNDLTSTKSLFKQAALGFADVVTNTVLPTMAMTGGATMMAGAMSNLEAMGTAALGAYAYVKFYHTSRNVQGVFY